MISKSTMSKFDTLFEGEMEQFQTGGYRVGMRVRFAKDALRHEYVQKRAQSFQDIIKSCMDPGFDLNLKIGAIKSIYPTTTQNYGNGTQSPDGTFFDVYIEYAPGLFRNPMTVPIDIVEIIDDENNLSPIPNSVKRPNDVHGPEEFDTSYDLTSDNTKLPGANRWDDTKPGGGNFKT